MARAYIGIGSNLGDREAAFKAALTALADTKHITVLKVSAPLETEPIGGPEQPDFLNAAAELQTSLLPRALLGRLLAIEDELGRVRVEIWGPRVIDLDLLLYDDQVIDEPGLQVPHPLMHTRAFVLKPLTEIAPQAMHPALAKTAAQLLAEL